VNITTSLINMANPSLQMDAKIKMLLAIKFTFANSLKIRVDTDNVMDKVD
jgi:hypothetical protein